MEPAAGDRLFVDTNILLTATDRGRSLHAEAREVLSTAGPKGLHMVVSGQVVREYLVVATRPLDANGLGMKPADAVKNADAFLQRMIVLDETERVSERLCKLTRAHGLCGKRIHDANIAATMLVHGVDFLLTANPEDFRVLPEIQLLDVAALARLLAE